MLVRIEVIGRPGADPTRRAVRASIPARLIAGILLTFASVTFAAAELRRSRRNSQVEFLFNIITWYLGDQALRSLFYKLDYNTWKFDKKKIPGSKDKPNLDKKLFVFDLLERFVASKNIALSDLSMIAFEASRVVHNPEVERYLTWLDEEYRQAEYPTPAYEGARKLAQGDSSLPVYPRAFAWNKVRLNCGSGTW